MTEETITLSHQEIDRLSVIQSAIRRQLTQAETALQLGIGIRQIKRLVRAYRIQGAAGLISRHRGKRPNNATDDIVRQQALKLVQEHYADFSPTFAHEKLTELHGFHFSVETLRQWMTAGGLWQVKLRKQAHIHQRRPRLGELVQIDGSPHDWFEERGSRCTLIVFIDDATSRLMALRFAPTETTQALHHPDIPFCRYADDDILHCRTEAEANLLRKQLAVRLRDCGLEMNPGGVLQGQQTDGNTRACLLRLSRLHLRAEAHH